MKVIQTRPTPAMSPANIAAYTAASYVRPTAHDDDSGHNDSQQTCPGCDQPYTSNDCPRCSYPDRAHTPGAEQQQINEYLHRARQETTKAARHGTLRPIPHGIVRPLLTLATVTR